jgi:hypothetical protein
VTETPELPLDAYPGLPKGAFHKQDLPRPAAMALGIADEGVWSAAVETYLSVIDPSTGSPDHNRPLADAAAGAVHNAAATCQAVALDYSARTDDRAAAQEVEAAKHIAEAVDTIEHASGIMHELVTGPDGEKLDGWQMQAIHQRDEALARQRSSEGDARHTQHSWEKSWRLIAATLLGVMDALLLWKPLLNLSFEGSADNTFRWAIGVGMVSLQVLAIEWAARTFVDAERLSVDRRGAAGDHNRPLTSRLLGDNAAPTTDDIAEADRQYSHGYHALVGVAAGVALVGGVRVAWLGRQAELPFYEATLFGIVIGLVLGCVVVQMARLYCRGNLLGDRLQIESDALEAISGRFKRARGRVSSEREAAHNALAAAEVLANHAATLRELTLADYRRAVELAWTWFGLPPGELDHEDFIRRAQPVAKGPSAKRDALLARLDIVNQWLADRGSIFNPAASAGIPQIAADQASEQHESASPARRPEGNKVVIIGRALVEIPERPKPPHRLMLAGALATAVATVTTAWFAPAVALPSTETAQALIEWISPLY